jgi:hypothetical protein
MELDGNQGCFCPSSEMQNRKVTIAYLQFWLICDKADLVEISDNVIKCTNHSLGLTGYK